MTDDIVEVFDTCYYANGKSYVVTDHGPNVWAQCALCKAPAACTPEMPAAAVRCGQCLLLQFEMVPGQRIYELKAQYAKEHAPPRWERVSK